jgi:simple sugar transport system ATP-binding protein
MQGDLVYLENIRAQYGTLLALNGVSLNVRHGEVLGLLGDSGAGKTTLAHVLTGSKKPSSGTMYLEGAKTVFRSAAGARRAGIEIAYQNFGLVDTMSICRNLFVGHELLRGGLPVAVLDRRGMESRAAKALAAVGLADLSPRQLVGSLSVSEKRALAICRASTFCTRLLVLDEPLDGLEDTETGLVLRTVQAVKQKGLSVLFITHNAHEVFDIADRFVILNQGKNYTEVQRDDTNARQLEKLLISTRLSTVREMTAGVAHQIRNPLAVMRVSAQMLRDDFTVVSKKGDFDRITSLLIAEINTLSVLIQNFLSFARPRNLERSQCSVADMIEAAIATLPLRDYPGNRIVQRISAAPATYSMDKDLMVQVVANLVMNGLQASSPTGAVEVRTFSERNLLCIEIHNWGRTIDHETRRKMFIPFFTTKTNGIGLGLAIVVRIVEQHGGFVDVTSSDDRGTTFRVVI